MDAEDVGARFGYMALAGGRFDAPGLPVASAAELERYARLVNVVAKHLYLKANPTRKRVPPRFEAGFDLRISDVDRGSVVPVIVRREEQQDLFGTSDDFHERARRLINEALGHINATNALPDDFPTGALGELIQFGRGLRGNEREALGESKSEITASVTTETRRRVQAIAKLDELEVEVVVLGRIVGLTSPNNVDLLMTTDSGQPPKKFSTTFSDMTLWSGLQDRLGRHEHAPLTSLSVLVAQDTQQEITRVLDVLSVELTLPTEWEERVGSLAALEDGWTEPDVAKPTEAVISHVQSTLLACLDAETDRPAIYPSADGGAQLEWRGRLRTVELDLLNDGSVDVTAFSERSSPW
ncbi:hypothetical protein [Gordonia sp. (in: high G+C Gram-positive bacteria)]|uniref:hypothetical protein n=1 Tax=Gordonia sp. (in: high G+C Gram-positive bacteria) TaxID=84139 RepID=UPI003C767E3B